MSRFDGWLVRYIMVSGTPAAMSIRVAAREATVRPLTFADALRDQKLVRADAVHLGMDPDAWRSVREWTRSLEAEAEVRESMVASGQTATDHNGAGIRRIPESGKYKGSFTRLGVTCPNPGGSRHRDNLNLPIDPIEHPEPQGEWHHGLNAAAPGRR